MCVLSPFLWLPKQRKSPAPTEMSYFSVMTPSSSIPTNNLLEYTCHAYFYYRPLISSSTLMTSCANLYYILTCITFWLVFHFALLHYALEKLLHFALVLHFAAILITFCVSITFCGDYYILRRNRRRIALGSSNRIDWPSSNQKREKTIDKWTDFFSA